MHHPPHGKSDRPWEGKAGLGRPAWHGGLERKGGTECGRVWGWRLKQASWHRLNPNPYPWPNLPSLGPSELHQRFHWRRPEESYWGSCCATQDKGKIPLTLGCAVANSNPMLDTGQASWPPYSSHGLGSGCPTQRNKDSQYLG